MPQRASAPAATPPRPDPPPGAARAVEPSRAPLSRRIGLGLAAVLILGLALRLIGLDHLLPSHLDPDWDLVLQVEIFRGKADAPGHERAYGLYPHLIARTIALLPDPELAPGDATPRGLDEHLAAASAFLTQVRLVVALVSFLIVPATWLLARRFLAPGAALLATFLMAVSLLDGHFSQQTRLHSPGAALALVAVVACVRLVERRDLVSVAWAGLACALALGCLQSGAAVGFPLAAALLLCLRREGPKVLAWAAIPAALLLLSLVVFYPFAFDGADAPSVAELAVEEEGIDLWGHTVSFELWTGAGFPRMAHAVWSYEPWLALLAPLGALTWLVRRRGAWRSISPQLAVVLAYVLPYTVVVGLYTGYERFTIQLLPYLCCATAYGLAQWRESFRTRVGPAGRRVALAAAALVVVALPLGSGLWFAKVRVAESSTERVALWIEENTVAGEESVLLVPNLQVPLFWSEESLELAGRGFGGQRRFAWVTHQLAFPPESRAGAAHDLYWPPLTFRRLKALGRNLEPFYELVSAGDYVVVEVYRQGRNLRALTGIRELLRERATLMERIGPDRDPEAYDDPILYQEETRVDPFPFLWRILHARSMGPVYEIYRT